jgi:hypothetical protein
MKGLLSVLVLSLLVTAVLVAGSTQSRGQSASDADTTDIISRMIAEINSEISGMTHPLSSACSSPAFNIYEQVSNPDGESNDHDHCIQFFAVQTGDTSQCAGIQRGAPKTKCYCLIASNKNDMTICDQVPPTNDATAYLKIDCLWEVAIRNNNADACRKIGNVKISRMITGEESQQACLARLESGQGVGESTL